MHCVFQGYVPLVLMFDLAEDTTVSQGGIPFVIIIE